VSQAGINNTTSGPVPPTVPQSFVTDVNSPAVPIANVLNVIGGSTTTNNANGIQTDGSSGSNTLTIQLTNTYTQTTTTVGAVNSTVTILSALAAGTYVLDMKVGAYATAGGTDGNGYTIVGAVRSDGVTATLLNGQQKDSFEETVGANAVMGVSGNTITVTVTGIVGISFDWKVNGDYMVVS
jgi:hypothetical protein